MPYLDLYDLRLSHTVSSTWSMRTLIGVGVNYRNDALVDEANAGPDPETVEREHPELAAALAARHDRNASPGFWKEPYS